MQRRNLGQTGATVSVLGIGAMSFTDFYGPTDTAASHALLAAALDLGIDHLDTANIYGNGVSEERIGSFLKTLSTTDRGFFKIATKAANRVDADGNRCFDNSRDHLTEELEKSLKRLGVDCVELFYVHRRDSRIEVEEVADTLAGLVAAGKTRAVGFSEIAPSTLARAHAVHPIAAVQSEYSLSTRSPELGLVQKTAEIGASLVAFSPVGRSLLTDDPHDRAKAETIPFLKNNPRFMEPNLTANIAATEGFRTLADDFGVTAAGLAIAWLLHKGDHILPIPGTRSVERLREMAAGAALSLSDDDMNIVESALPLGWAHGDRYSKVQWAGPENYC